MAACLVRSAACLPSSRTDLHKAATRRTQLGDLECPVYSHSSPVRMQRVSKLAGSAALMRRVKRGATPSFPRCNTANALLSSGAWPVLVLEESRQPRHVHAHSLLRDGQAEGLSLVTPRRMTAIMCLKLALHISLPHRPCIVYLSSFETYINIVRHMQHSCHTQALHLESCETAHLKLCTATTSW